MEQVQQISNVLFDSLSNEQKNNYNQLADKLYELNIVDIRKVIYDRNIIEPPGGILINENIGLDGQLNHAVYDDDQIEGKNEDDNSDEEDQIEGEHDNNNEQDEEQKEERIQHNTFCLIDLIMKYLPDLEESKTSNFMQCLYVKFCNDRVNWADARIYRENTKKRKWMIRTQLSEQEIGQKLIKYASGVQHMKRMQDMHKRKIFERQKHEEKLRAMRHIYVQ